MVHVRQIQQPLQLDQFSAALKSEASRLIAFLLNSKAVNSAVERLNLFLPLDKKVKANICAFLCISDAICTTDGFGSSGNQSCFSESNPM